MSFLESRRIRVAFFVLAMVALLLPAAATADIGALDFYTLTSIPPCRLVDTRMAADAPILTAGVPRTFTIVGSVGSPPCNVPADAAAVALNVTVAEPSASGNLSLYPTGVSPTYAPGFELNPMPPSVAALSYLAGHDRGKILLLELKPDGQVTAVASAGTVHLIIDVSGYFLGAKAVADTATINEDDPATAIPVLANDLNPESDTLTIASASDPANGTVMVAGDGLSLTYEPDPDYCNDPPGTTPDTFTYTLNPSGSKATVEVTVSCQNDAPELTAGGGTATFTEGGSPVVIDGGILVSDVDDTDLVSATVTITNPLDGASEVLAATDCAGLLVTPGLNTLSITGSQPKATYQACLRSVTYENTSSNPDVTQRSISFTVNDGDVDSNTLSRPVNLTSTNNQPTISAIDDQTIAEDTSTAALAFTVGDVETPVASLTVTGASSDTSIIPNANIVFGGSGASRTVTVTPAADATGGPVTITVTVDDGSGAPNATATETFTVTVTAANDQPTISAIADQTIDEDTSTGALAFTVGDAETAPGTLTVSGSSSDTTLIPNANIVFGGSGASRTVTVTPAANLSGGPVTITITVDDGSAQPNSTAMETFTVTVNAVNDQPTISDVGDQTINEDTSTGPLAFTVGDQETAAASLTLSGSSSNTAIIPNGNIVFGGSGANRTVTVTPAANANGGPVTITITVDDGSAQPNSTASDTFTVTITSVNDQPTISAIADQTINEDTSTGALAFTIGDVETPAGSLALSGSSSDTTLIPNANIVFGGSGASRTVTVTPAPNLSGGPVTITITVDDGSAQPNSTAVETFTVTVTNVNDQPTISAIADQTIDEDTSTGALAFTVGDQETPAASLTLSGSSSNPAIIPNGNIVFGGSGASRTVTVTPSANAFGGPVTITVTVDDGSAQPNSTAVETFTVTVNSVNDQPTISAIADQTINEDTSTGALAFTVGDVETAPGSLTVSGSSSDTAIIPNGNIVFGGSGASRTVTVTPALNANGGPVTITVTVNDGSGAPNATVIETFTVTVIPVNDAPVLGGDTTPDYTAVGNTRLRAGGTPPIVAAVAFSTDAASVMSKVGPVTDVDGPGPIEVVAASGPTANGGTFAIEADGDFTYHPPTGFTGTDTFGIQITDHGVPAGLANATVTIVVSEMVWYVQNNTGTAGTAGTSADPFDTLNEAQGASGVNHYIYVFKGDGTTNKQNAGILLKSGQRLLGEAVNLVVSGKTLVTGNPANLPLVGNSAGNGVSATDVVPAEIRGLSLSGNVNAIDLTNAVAIPAGSTLTIQDNVIRAATTAEGIDINLNAGTTGTLALNIVNNSWDPAGTHAGNAVDINRAAGTLNLNFSGNTNIVSANAAGAAVNISGGALANTTITGFSGNSVLAGTAGAGILASNATFDQTPGGTFQTVSGGTTTIGGAGTAGIGLSNVAGDLSFANLLIVAGNGTGLQASGITPYTGSAGFQVTVANNATTKSVTATGGPAVSLSTVAANLPSQIPSPAQMTVVSTNSSSTGVALNSVTGAFSAGSGSSITGSTGTGFQVGSSSVNVTYDGTITTTAGKGIDLTSNSGSIAFSGVLTLSSGGNTAFNATGGGTVTATNTSSTLTSTTGTALNVSGTTIGALGLKFRSISSNGGGNSGIVLNSTGSLGGLNVGGNGGTCTSAATCTGGAIQNKTVDGVSLNNTRDVTLTRMFIDNNDGSGIFGDDLTNFSLINSVVTNNTDVTGGAEAGLRFNELIGNCAITNSTISNNFYDNIRYTPASNTLTSLAISGGVIGPNDGTVGNNGITILASGTANATVSVSGTTFNDNRASHFLGQNNGSGLVTLSVSGSTFNNGNIAVDLGHAQSGDLNFTISGNMIVGADSNAINFSAASTSTNNGDVVGTITGNTIGNAATVDSGSRDAFGIGIDAIGDVDMVLSITNNVIRHTDFEGIFVESAFDDTDADAETALLDLTLRDNDVGQPDDNSAFPFGTMYGVRVEARHTSKLCLDVAGNNAASVGGVEHFRFRQRNTASFTVERLTDGDGTPNEVITNMATVEAFLVGQNDAGSTVDATNQTAGVTGFTEAANGLCRKP